MIELTACERDTIEAAARLFQGPFNERVIARELLIERLAAARAEGWSEGKALSRLDLENAREEGRQEERRRPLGFDEIILAARVLCRVTCSAYPCRDTCEPSSTTWDLAVDMLRAQRGWIRTPQQHHLQNSAGTAVESQNDTRAEPKE